jgi:hypothetical protein
MLGDKEAKDTVDVLAPATAEDRAALLKQVQSKAIDGFLSIQSSPESADGLPIVTYTSQSAGDFTTSSAPQRRRKPRDRQRAPRQRRHEPD